MRRYTSLMTAVAWSAIGLLAATLVGSFFYLGNRIDSLGARIDSLDSSLSNRIDTLNSSLSARIDTLDARLSSRIDALGSRLDAHLERHPVQRRAR